MRIRRKIQLAGLAVAMVGGVSGTAEAGDRTISTAVDAPVVTSNPDGSGIAGDVTITASGTITVEAAEAGVTVNSNNDVSNAGSIVASDANNATGILLQGGNSGTITNSGAITLTETYVIADSDSDGNLDGNLAIGTNRHAIFLQAGPTFTGDILSSGFITVEGNNSSGITLNGLLTGDLTVSSALAITGENSFGVAINGGVTGDAVITGGGAVRGQNSVGVHVNSAIGGELSVNGSWATTGYLSTTVPADQGTLDSDDLEQGGSVLLVNGNVAGGVTIEGIGVENDIDDDDDGEENEADDNVGAVLSSFGSAPVLHFQADGSNLVVGAGAEGYGLLVRGQVVANGLFNGVEATGVRIEGDGLGATATITGGVSIDNSLTANASEEIGRAHV